MSVLTTLRFEETSELVERLLNVQEKLDTEGKALAAALHEVIGGATTGSGRARLVGLRRALHNGRLPAASERDAATGAIVPPALATRIQRWLEQLHGWRADRERLRKVLAAESRTKENSLRSVTGDPGFRRALWNSSPALAREHDKWLDDRLRRPRRQSLSRLAKYVSRAAAKTSPSSAFAVSGIGAWSDDGPGVRIAGEPNLRGVLQLHGPLQDSIIDALLRRPAVREAVEVRPNPSITSIDRHLSFLGRPPGEPILGLPATAAVRECLDVLTNGHAATLGELGAHLAAGSGAPLHEITGFLDHLVVTGLLELVRPAHADPRKWDELAAWSAARGEAGLATVSDALRTLARELSAPVPVHAVSDYRAQRDKIQLTVERLRQDLGLDQVSDSAPDTVLHDSVVCTGTAACLASAAWAPALRDLDLLRCWLAVFNPALAVRLAVTEIWRARFQPGSRAPFMALHRTVQHEAAAGNARAGELRRLLSGGTYGRQPQHSEFPSVRELWRLQEHALEPIMRQRRDASDEVHVDPVLLAELATGWPPWVAEIASLGCYVQPVMSNDELGLVLNVAHAGPRRGWNRVAHLLTLAGDPPHRGGGRQAEAEPVLAELGGTNGSTVNDRVPSVSHEIDYPFTDSRRPAAQRLPLSDLVVEEDPATGVLRLHSARLGREVRALDLGLLMLPALPPAARLLVQAFGDSPIIHTTPAFEEPPPPPTVRRWPRVTAGNVVLRRARWVVDAAGAPRRQRGEADDAYLLRLVGWLRSTGIPRRCFVRAQPATSDDAVGLMVNKSRKPVYIDFDSWFLVLAFENMHRAPGTEVLVFDEALPDPASATEPAGEPRAVEFLVELSDRKN